MKTIIGILMSAICVAFALIPEGLMFFVYQFIAPETSLERILIFGLFAVFGGSVCVLFAFLGIALWTTLMKALIDS